MSSNKINVSQMILQKLLKRNQLKLTQKISRSLVRVLLMINIMKKLTQQIDIFMD